MSAVEQRLRDQLDRGRATGDDWMVVSDALYSRGHPSSEGLQKALGGGIGLDARREVEPWGTLVGAYEGPFLVRAALMLADADPAKVEAALTRALCAADARYMSLRRLAVLGLGNHWLDWCGFDFSAMGFGAKRFHFENLIRACFADAILYDPALAAGSEFNLCDLRESTLVRASLQNVRFVRTDLRSVVFDGADLRGARFDSCEIQEASFHRTIFTRSDLDAFEAHNADCQTAHRIDLTRIRARADIRDG